MLFRSTPSGLYLCRDAATQLSEASGGTALAALGSPVYQSVVGDRLGTYYPSGAAHVADVYALGAASWWYVGVIDMDQPASNMFFVGRANLFSVNGAWIYRQGTAGWSLLVRDSGGTQMFVQSTLEASQGTWLAQLQVDRTAGVARARLSRFGGPADQVSGSIAGFLTLDTVGQNYGAGNLAGGAAHHGAKAGLLAAATGAQVEGANFLASMARALGAE